MASPWQHRQQTLDEDGQQGPHEMTTAEIVANQSQDYIDEKELEYLQTIHHLAEEQERVQKKTFVNWINAYLAQHIPPLKVRDLIEDMQDGSRLICLLEVLSGEKLHAEKGRVLKRPHFLSNVNTALQFLERKRVKLVNINASDVVDGRPAVVLGLVWTIILYFQIEEHTKLLAEQLGAMSSSSLESVGMRSGGSFGDLSSSDQFGQSGSWTPPTVQKPSEKIRTGAKRALLQWVRNAVASRGANVDVVDFGRSWRDGNAFLAVVSAIRPDLVDWNQCGQMSNRSRLQMAFDVAEQDLGIPRLLDAEDVDVQNPDEKSVMTYVAQFLHRFPETSAGILSQPLTASDVEKSEYQELINWLQETEQSLQSLDTNIEDKHWEYAKLKSMKNDLDQHRELYQRTCTRCNSGVAVYVTQEMWKQLEQRWNKVETQLYQWQWMVDSRLPGQLGQIGEWLNHAEQLLRTDVFPTGNESYSESAKQLAAKIQEHKAVFQGLPNMLRQLEKCQSPALAGSCPPEQLHDIAVRLSKLSFLSNDRLSKLELELCRYKLLAFISTVQEKALSLSGKLGLVDSVEKSLGEYNEFVSNMEIFRNYETLYSKLTETYEICKKETKLGAEKFLREVNEKWKKATTDLHSAKNLLEDGVQFWQRYLRNVDLIKKWLNQAVVMVMKPEDERTEFFIDLGTWHDAIRVLNEAGGFLMSACEESIAVEIQQQLRDVNSRWEALLPHVQEYLTAGEAMKTKHDYKMGITKLRSWLRTASQVLATTKTCDFPILEAHVQELQQLQQECEEAEAVFKTISKRAQALIREISRNDVDAMMSELKKEKEALLTVRATIPSRLYLFHQLLAQREAFDSGTSDILKWLADAEALLGTHTLAGSREQISVRLEKHRSFFSRLPFYRSILENKNKVCHTMIRSADGSQGVDTKHLHDMMADLNNQFNRCATSAVEVERQLEQTLRFWQNYYECERNVVQFIQTTEKIISDKFIPNQQKLESQKKFLEQPSEDLVRQLATSSEQLQRYVNEPNHEVQQNVQQLVNRYTEIMDHVPRHFVRMEFNHLETVVRQALGDIERELTFEQQLYNNSDDVKSLLQRHILTFQDGEYLPILDSHFEVLESLCQKFTVYNPFDQSLQDKLDGYKSQYQRLQNEINAMCKLLQDIPNQWKIYEEKFDDLVKWMDQVDEAVAKINADAIEAKDFDELQAKFKEVSDDVDSRREDMKWLIQQLDVLMSRCSEEVARTEQKKLEELISRYKALLPNIESTVVRLDTVSKCFLYREEVLEVTSWLRKTAEQVVDTKPEVIESSDNLEELIIRHEILIKELEERRTNILTSLQKGKGLQQDANAPAFMRSDVDELEALWNEAYNQALGKLSKLKSTRDIWSEYESQKEEILRLLEKAEQELELIGKLSSKDAVQSELSTKQDLKEQLQQATDILFKRLQELAASLVDKSGPQQQPIFDKDIIQIEKQIHTVMTTVKEKVVLLEEVSSKWSTFIDQLEELKRWLEEANKSIAKIKSLLTSPEEKAFIVQKLETEIIEKSQVVRTLEKDGDELTSAEEDDEQAGTLRQELQGLRNEIDRLTESLQQQTLFVKEELSQWSNYQKRMDEIKPWLDEAEVKIASLQSKLSSLREGKLTRDTFDIWRQECYDRLLILNSVEESRQSGDHGELLDTINRLTELKTVIEQWLAKMDILLNIWENLTEKLHRFGQWLTSLEEKFKKPLVANTPISEKLEHLMNELSQLSREAMEHQKETITFTQDVDNVTTYLSQDASDALRSQLCELKTRLAQLIEALHARQSQVSESIVNAKEFANKMDEFQMALEQIQQSIDALDEVYTDRIAQALQTVKNLSQEVQEFQTTFTEIYQRAKQYNDSCFAEDVQLLNETYSKLSEQYQMMEDLLALKEKLLQKWTEFANWHVDTVEQLKWSIQQLEMKNVTSEELGPISVDVDTVSNSVDRFKENVEELRQLQLKSRTTIKDASTGAGCEITSMLREVTQLVEKLTDKIKRKEGLLADVTKKKTDFQASEKEFEEFVQDIEEKANTIVTADCSIEAVESSLKQIQGVLQDVNDRETLLTSLHEQGRELLQTDLANLTPIQNTLSNANKTWERLQSSLLERKKFLASILSLWQSCKALRRELEALLDECERVLKDVDKEITELSQAQVALGNVKTALSRLNGSRMSLELFTRKSIQLMQQVSIIGTDTEELNGQMDALCDRWNTVFKAVERKVQNLETQMLFWHQIEQSETELSAWLQHMSDILGSSGAPLGFQDCETARLNLEKYKAELPTYQQTFSSISSKMNSLEELNGGSISSIQELQKNLNDKMSTVNKLARDLEVAVEKLSQQENAIRHKMQDIADWLVVVRDNLSKIDTSAGPSVELLRRLHELQVIIDDLESRNPDFEALEARVKQTEEKTASNASALLKELRNLRNRYDILKSQTVQVSAGISNTLQKNYETSLQLMQRWIKSNLEKLSWCQTESSDNVHSLEAKSSALNDVVASVSDGQKLKLQLDEVRNVLLQHLTDTIMLNSERDATELAWNQFEETLNETKSNLMDMVSVWRRFDESLETMGTVLKEVESILRNETGAHSDLSKTEEILSTLHNLNVQLDELQPIVSEMMAASEKIHEMCPEGHASHQSNQMAARYKSNKKMVDDLLQRLRQLIENQEIYQAAVNNMNLWLNDFEDQLRTRSVASPIGDKPTMALVQRMKGVKELLQRKAEAQTLLGSAMSAGETLYPAITADGRERLRSELRTLRDRWENYWENVNHTYKRLEMALMQWTSFDDNCTQVAQWLQDIKLKVDSNSQPQSTLQDKKSYLQILKGYLQDVMSYESIIVQLEERNQEFLEEGTDETVTGIRQQFESLKESLKAQVEASREHVAEHEAYQRNLEEFYDWLSNLNTELEICKDTSDLSVPDSKLSQLKELQGQKSKGDTFLRDIELKQKPVELHTSPAGQQILQKELQSALDDWKKFTDDCAEGEDHLKGLLHHWDECNTAVEELSAWLKSKEIQVLDQSLKSTLEAKQAQLEIMIALEKEIIGKQDVVAALVNRAQHVEGDTRIGALAAQLGLNYQTLKTAAKEATSKLDSFIKEHIAYNKCFASCEQLLHEMAEMLNKDEGALGDLEALKDRNDKLEELSLRRTAEAPKIEATIELGERLYSHTSPEGRETIRQQLRSLQERWDGLVATLNEMIWKVDTNLQQLEGFLQSKEQIERWLVENDSSLKTNFALKNNLLEKKAALQSHRILHQEVVAQENAVTTLVAKVHNFSALGDNDKLVTDVHDIQDAYSKLKDKSQALLDKLEQNVDDHQHYQTACRNFREWMNTAQEQLLTLSDTHVDESKLLEKMDDLKLLSRTKEEGEKQMEQLLRFCKQVAANTEPSSENLMRKDVENLQEAWQVYLSNLEDVEKMFQSVIDQWTAHRKNMDRLSDWIAEVSNRISGVTLKATLREKENQLRELESLREDIVAKEPDVDMFMDEAHGLLHSSGVENLKSQASQINSKYQALHTSSKELVVKWQSIVNEHSAFDRDVTLANSWLDGLEKSLRDTTAENDPAERMTMLQYLVAETERPSMKLSTIFAISEKIFPDTAANGREDIRNKLRDLQGRWEALDCQVDELQKKLDTHDQQYHLYTEAVQQLKDWLELMEKPLKLEQSGMPTIQEVKARLARLKNLQQDVASHKRLLENVKDRAQCVLQLQPQNAEEINETVESLAAKYEDLRAKTFAAVSSAESIGDDLQRFQAIHQAYHDWEMQMWEKINWHSDYSGSKPALLARRDKVQEIVQDLVEGEHRLQTVSQQAESLMQFFSERAKETLERDLVNHRHELVKLQTAVNEISSGLETRLKQWNTYENRLDVLLAWLADTENILKAFSPESTMQGKKEQLRTYQDLLVVIQKTEVDLTQLKNAADELIQVSKETRISVNVQQVIGRYQSLLATAKEVLKRCEQQVQDHQSFVDNYDQLNEWLANAQNKIHECSELSGDKDSLKQKFEVAKDLMRDKSAVNSQLNVLVDASEKVYLNTSPEGRDVIWLQVQSLRQGCEAIFDSVSAIYRDLESKLSKLSMYQEDLVNLSEWLKEVEAQLGRRIRLASTLEEKKSQLNSYRAIRHDLEAHHPAVLEVKRKSENLADGDHSVEEISKIVANYNDLSQRTQAFIERYEAIVGVHQQLSSVIKEAKIWLASSAASLSSCSDIIVDRIGLQSNLERLKILQALIPDEEYHVTRAKPLSKKVIADTADEGHATIRKTVEDLDSELRSLGSSIESAILNLTSRIALWDDYDQRLEKHSAWFKEIDSKLHMIDLQPTLNDKIDQQEALKNLQGTIRAKDIEMDVITELAQQLYGGSGTHRGSVISDLGIAYQQLSSRVKDLVARWQQYVSNHREYETRISSCRLLMADIGNKLNFCSDLGSGTLIDQESKLAAVKELMVLKEEGYGKLQSAVEMAQITLTNTSPEGHVAINKNVEALQEDWSLLTSRMVETKAILDETIQKWAGFLENIRQVDNVLEQVESALREVAPLQATLSEKRNQVERLKAIGQQLSSINDHYDVDGLRLKIGELALAGQQDQATQQAEGILHRLDVISETVKNLAKEREQQYKDHNIYKEAYDDLVIWINQTRDKVPSMTRSPLGDRLALEAGVAALDQVLNKMTQGQMKVDNVMRTGEAVLNTTSPSGQDLIIVEMKSLQEDFETLFKDIQDQKDKLEIICVQWREFKEEYEETSDLLQKIEAELRTNKTTLKSTLDEKLGLMQHTKSLLEQLQVTGQEKLNRLNKITEGLMASHLDTYVGNQLRHLNSRYQVLVNMAKDVLMKVEQNYEHHKLYEENHSSAKVWMEEARQITKDCGESVSTKEALQAQLERIQSLLENQDEGSALVQSAVNWGEKAARSSRPEMKVTISRTLADLQTEWDRLNKKMSNAKVGLESSLLQWADYSQSYEQLKGWLSERESKLNQVLEDKGETSRKGIGEKRARLRKTNSFVLDIVAFEPVIESVSTKAEELLQKSPQCRVADDASEIATKYKSLSKQAREFLEQQKQLVQKHQSFMDLSQEFLQWLRVAKEKLAKCSSPMGDKETLTGKMNQVRVLEKEEDDGEEKLGCALSAAEVALENCEDEDDKNMIEEEVGTLRDEFEHLRKGICANKSSLEAALSKWTDYEELLEKCSAWLSETEASMQEFTKLQSDLDGKRSQLEQFQVLLQVIFDWQKELDELNLKAQMLLENCADSRVSNSVTQLSTRYNTLISVAKEVMRQLEQRYQEHQQQQCMHNECVEWIEKTRDKLDECLKPTDHLEEMNNKLQTLKNLKTAMEQGQHKLRYLVELKEKVVLTTDASGAAKIQETIKSLEQEFEKLSVDIAEARQAVVNRMSAMDEVRKAVKMLTVWLQEIEEKVNADVDVECDDLAEMKAKLEKYKVIQRDVLAHSSQAEGLQKKLNDDTAKGMLTDVTAAIDRYGKLSSVVKKSVENLEEQVGEQELFRNAYREAHDWLLRARLEAQECGECLGDKKAILGKLDRLSALMGTFPQGTQLIESAQSLGVIVLEHTGADGQEVIKRDLEQLSEEWQRMVSSCESASKALESCSVCWHEYETLYNTLSKWLCETDEEVKFEMSRDSSSQTAMERATKFTTFLHRAEEQKKPMDDINEKAERLMELSSSIHVREDAVQLLRQYATLMSTLQNQVNKIERTLADHKEYLEVKGSLEAWLAECEQILNENCLATGNEDAIQLRLDTLKTLGLRQSEGQHMMNQLAEVGSKAMNTMDKDMKESTWGDITKLRESLDNLTMSLNQNLSKLKASIGKLHEFGEDVAKLRAFLEEADSKLSKTSDCKGNVVEIRTEVIALKNLQEELEGKSPDLADLAFKAEELVSKTENDVFMADIISLKTDHQNLVARCCNSICELESQLGEFQDYQQSLQEIEKWLLQTSFQLMAHNSLFINSLAQTIEQMRQHQTILSEISAYQSTVDDVKAKGMKLIQQHLEESSSQSAEITKQMANIRSSYNSLVTTAKHIQSRLQDSMKKFQEYEDALDIINKALDAIEPGISKEQDSTPASLEDAKNHQNSIRNLLNRLNIEKQRLQAAVQCCEDATASLSRPSSPEGGPSLITSEKELHVRLRLEDLIDQSENLLTSITKVVNEWEELERRREELQKWIGQKEALLVDLRSKPYRLRPEAAQTDTNKVKEMKTQIEEKHQVLGDIEQRQQNLAPSPSDENIRERLNALEIQVSDLVDSRQKIMKLVEDYRYLMGKLQQWSDALVKKLDSVEKGEGLSNKQKAERLKEMNVELDEYKALLEDVQAKASDVMPELGGMDVQQVEEQIKSAERKLGEMQKRAQRQTSMLDVVGKEYESVLKEIQSTEDWIKERLEDASRIERFGHKSASVEAKIQSVSSVKHDVDGKSLVVDTLQKQVDGLVKKNLDATESGKLQQCLRKLEEDHQQLVTTLKQVLKKLSEALEKRHRFEENVETVQQWILEKLRRLASREATPLRAQEVEKTLENFKKINAEVRMFEEGSVTDVKKLASAILKECDDDSRTELLQILRNIEELLEQLKAKLSEIVRLLSEELMQRRDLEENIDKLQQWLRQAAETLGSEARQIANLEVIEERLNKFVALGQESGNAERQLQEIIDKAMQFEVDLNETEKISMKAQLDELRGKHASTSKLIQDRIAMLQKILDARKQYDNKIKESVVLLQELQQELNGLNKPVGPTIKDAQDQFANYQDVLKKFQDLKDRLEELQDQSSGSTSDLESLVGQLHDVLQHIDAQMTKLRQMIVLRQQFQAIIADVLSSLNKLTEDATVIEASEAVVTDKIRRYGEIISRLNDCDASLLAATDKGRRIGEEGDVGDRNTVNEQLQSLKTQLGNFRRLVESRKAEHENMAAELSKVQKELEAEIDWLHQSESVIRCRPPLKLDSDSVKTELENNKVLQSDVLLHLNKLDAVVKKLKSDYEVDTLPTVIQERMSEACLLQLTLLPEIEERTQYLYNALSLREDYKDAVAKLTDWFRKASAFLDRPKTGIEFETLNNDLANHKEVFANQEQQTIKCRRILALADKISPSLEANNKEELAKELEYVQQKLEDTNSAAAKMQTELENLLDQWKKFQKLIAQVSEIISCDYNGNEANTVTELQTIIETVSALLVQLRENRDLIDTLRSDCDEVMKFSNAACSERVNEQVEDIIQRWKEICDKLANSHSMLQEILQAWKYFTQLAKTISGKLSEAEQQLSIINLPDLGGSQLDEAMLQLQSQLTECGDLTEDLGRLSSSAEDLLKDCDALSAKAKQSVRDQIDSISSLQKRLCVDIEKKIQWIRDEISYLENFRSEISALRISFENMQQDVDNLDAYDPDETSQDQTLKQMKDHIGGLDRQAKGLASTTQARYKREQHSVPAEVGQQLVSLELLADTVMTAMADKERDCKRARTQRYDFTGDVADAEAWLQQSEAKLLDKSLQPANLKEQIQVIQGGLGTVEEKVAKVESNGHLLCERTQNTAEQELIRSTVTALADQLLQLKKLLDERNEQVLSALDAWQRFLQSHSALKTWIMKTQTFLSEKLHYVSLSYTKQKLTEYQSVQKECTQMQKHITDMTRELERIVKVGNAGDLPDMKAELEQEKIEVEKQLHRKTLLLMEMTEEWEQCERKVKEVTTWLEKHRQSIESSQGKKRPLRDQLAMREKLAAEISTQKTKMMMSIEKLAVHFKDANMEETQIITRGRHLQSELDALYVVVAEQHKTLDVAVAQLDKYQHEVQELKRQVTNAEQHLRVVSSPMFSPRDRKKQQEEQDVCREKIKAIQEKISAVNERIRGINQRGIPDSEPLPC